MPQAWRELLCICGVWILLQEIIWSESRQPFFKLIQHCVVVFE